MLVISVFSNLKAQEVTSFSLYTPKSVNQSSPFEIELLAEINDDSLNSFEINFGFDQPVNFLEAKIISSNKRIKIPFIKNQLIEPTGNWFTSNINLKDFELKKGSTFQIITSVTTSATELLTVKSNLIILKNNNKKVRFPEISRNEINRSKNFLSEEIVINKNSKKGMKAVSLAKNSFLNQSVIPKSNRVFIVDFWLKFTDFKETFLNISNGEDKSEIISLGVNENRFLTFYDNLRHLQFFKKGFVSQKVWSHFIFELNVNEKILNYYLNGEKVAQSKINFSFQSKELTFEFVNNLSGSFLIENLRLTESREMNSFLTIFKNRNCDYARLDSINIIGFNNFDNSTIEETERVKYKSSNLMFVRSDAPIYSVVPEFNVTLTNAGCKLDWTAGDISYINYFQVEKSVSGNDYKPIAQVLADQTTEQYSYYDDDGSNSTTIHYRIKQVNHDGSFVYSASSKVGKGNVQTFMLAPNYPNPFNPKTVIKISVYEDTQVRVVVYSLEGKEVQRLHEGDLKKGEYQFEFDGSLLPSGIYLYTVNTPFFSQTKKMILAK
ncbi:MAG: T9SS type A sorting domain-containing protein [Ignavibacteriaceae bacterium]|nr:T9SS type A sorting domain-containing protein [Ignavibacteriaceae bacterium]